ncbi:glycosyltransferase [Pseudogracilibacillus auburnensis]|uniref:Spore maturation protein CgeB n=1 Tax=Pseudogracilibacillus auburnensis TaxID=1494959 RepID=A0A2V3VWC0_9BACI|nr:glycosyltransferase [Pseudogracilibacillus auburnensis]PXW85860.1 spore maturation protein CgeB [Pseudogracilibacillus auburnensis]
MFKLRGKKNDTVIDNLPKDIFQFNSWNFNKNRIKMSVDSNTMSIESKSRRVDYLTLYENNTKFSHVGKNEPKILLDKQNIFEISGVKSANVDVIFYLLEYDEKYKRIHTNRLKINDKKIITTQPQTKYARIAIRLAGKGKVEITNFTAKKYGLIDELASQGGKKMQDIKMACIFDEFSMASFKNVVSLTTFTPDNWSIVFEHEKPDLLMVESAWKGNQGSWEYEVATYNNNNQNQKLKELLLWCNKHKIPTVFWNKEDPVHFEKFKRTAALFDYIFTTDADMIPAYRKFVGHDRVYTLQFAANPTIHNPITADNNKKSRISFAGSYYSNRHPERKKDMDDVLKVAKEFGLDIFDRNYGKSNTDFNFPNEFKNNILGSLPYHQIYKAYKDYRLILNVNSVKNSPTMFSRRVFEGLASGTPVISSYAVGLKKTFKDLITIYENEPDFKKETERLMTDIIFYRKRAIEGMREVFHKHTYKKRMEYILDTVKVTYRKSKDDVTILFYLTSGKELGKALNIVENQTFEHIKVFLVLDLFEGHEEIINEYNNEKYSSYLMHHTKNRDITELIDTKYITVMDTKYTYGEHYLEDLMHACIYSNADIVGKKSLMDALDDYNYAEHEYKYVDNIYEETAVLTVEDIKYYSLKDIVQCRSNLIEVLYKQEGKRIFSSDKFNFSFGNESRNSKELQ